MDGKKYGISTFWHTILSIIYKDSQIDKKTLDITLKDILKPILQVYTLTFSIFLRTFSVSLVKSDEPDEPYPSASVNRTSADQQVIPASLTT